MYRALLIALILLSLRARYCIAQAQDASLTGPTPIRVVVGSPSAESATAIVVPPATSWTAAIAFSAPKKAASQENDLSSWVNRQNSLNGLQGLSTAWHIVITYEQFDKDGEKVHSGTYEELWAGPKKYRLSYKADDLNQTDYATAKSLYRLGDQQWPNRAQAQISREVIDPFFYAATLQGVDIRDVAQNFGDHTLDCAVVESGPGRISGPTQYCFDRTGPSLRYSRGAGWFQTTYNDLITFSGRSVAKAVDVYDGGKPYLKLHMQQLEAIANAGDEDFIPPPEAKDLSGQVLSGVIAVPMQRSLPEWPDSLRQQHFSVTVEILIGKDGHVKSAHAVSGPPNAFKSAEATALKWTFQPYLVLDQPAEVTTKIELSNH